MIYIQIPTHVHEINHALISIQDRYRDSLGNPYPAIDETFEEENRCKILYDRKTTPIVIMFEEEDWFWFKAKWA